MADITSIHIESNKLDMSFSLVVTTEDSEGRKKAFKSTMKSMDHKDAIIALRDMADKLELYLPD